MNLSQSYITLGILIGTTQVAFASCEPVPPMLEGLVSQYLFNGNTDDSSGHGLHGENAGGTLTADRLGNPNSAYAFCGSDRIDIPPAQFSSTEGTIALWVYVPETMNGATGSGRIFPFISEEEPIDGNGRFLYLSLGDFTQLLSGEIFGILGGTGTLNTHRSAVSNGSITHIPCGWHHLAVTSDANGHFLYLDGVRHVPNLFGPGLSPSANLWPYHPTNAWIGGISTVNPALEPYAVDEVHIFSRALSEPEVAALASAAPSVDSDADGLSNSLENALTSDPYNSDSDGDGLLDGTEYCTAGESGCPDLLVADSDTDGLSDGAETTAGTNPCNSDTDGDGVPDGEDPLPLDPGVTSGWLEDEVRNTALEILEIDLDFLSGPNANANRGRRNALGNRAQSAANLISSGDYASAQEELQSLLEKIDGVPVPPDWMIESPETIALANQVTLMLELLDYLAS